MVCHGDLETWERSKSSVDGSELVINVAYRSDAVVGRSNVVEDVQQTWQNLSAVTSRRLIVTSYNLAITRFWYPATNNRHSLFTGSKHHVFMKIPVLETSSFLHLRYKVVCLFVSVQIMGFRHLLMPLCQFVVTSNSLHHNN